MNKLIATCGINCVICEARIATMKNDDDLRRITAEKWQKMFNSPDISPETINCTGCRQDGPKFTHCSVCEIRKCAIAKGFGTCAECGELEECQIVGGLHKVAPEALANLKSLN
jgi:hypothetical protein